MERGESTARRAEQGGTAEGMTAAGQVTDGQAGGGRSRRTVLRAGGVAGTAAILGTAGALRAGTASAAPLRGPKLPYPDVTDTTHASPQAARIFRGFFSAKSEHNATALMSYFSKSSAYYIDASSGSLWPSWQSLDDLFVPFFASGLSPLALSYPLRIIGDERSALVEFEDRPELFGNELRILGSVTFDNHQKIIRWIDYWDGRSALVTNSITSSYPTDFKDGTERASARVINVAKALQAAFGAGDAAAATALFTWDAVHEDMAAHTRVRGQLQIQRYYTRALGQLPFGVGAAYAHAEGSDQGGGFEWTAAPSAAPMRRGHTAIELDDTGLISRLTVIYDSSLLAYPAYQALVGLAAEAPQ